MASFKDYLKEEGITPSDEILHLDFPTQKNLPKGTKLKSLKLREGYDENEAKGFKRAHFPKLYEFPSVLEGKIKAPHVMLDLYPRIEALDTTADVSSLVSSARKSGKLSNDAISCFDWSAILEQLLLYKVQRGYSNLRVSKDQLRTFCENYNDWYTLLAPDRVFSVLSFESVVYQQSVLVRLLCEYTDRYYVAIMKGFEGQFYDLTHVDQDYPAIIEGYALEFQDSDDGLGYRDKLIELKQIVASKQIDKATKWAATGVVAISFDRHLFYPLLSKTPDANIPLDLRPLAFDAPSEICFVKDLEAYCETKKGKKLLSEKSLYLLRNPSTQSKGLGFATAGNFYPDFLLWIADEKTGQQWLTLVDPKGIRNLSIDDPKFGLFEEIKSIEFELDDPLLTLNAFVLSDTPYQKLVNIRASKSKNDLEDQHVLFMDDGYQQYLDKLFDRTLTH